MSGSTCSSGAGVQSRSCVVTHTQAHKHNTPTETMTPECDPTTRYGPDTHKKERRKGRQQPLISDEQQMNKSPNDKMTNGRFRSTG